MTILSHSRLQNTNAGLIQELRSSFDSSLSLDDIRPTTEPLSLLICLLPFPSRESGHRHLIFAETSESQCFLIMWVSQHVQISVLPFSSSFVLARSFLLRIHPFIPLTPLCLRLSPVVMEVRPSEAHLTLSFNWGDKVTMYKYSPYDSFPPPSHRSGLQYRSTVGLCNQLWNTFKAVSGAGRTSDTRTAKCI